MGSSGPDRCTHPISFGDTTASGNSRVNNVGYVNNLTLETARQQPLPKPTAKIPFARDPKFVDRKGTFKKIEDAFRHSRIGHPKVALYGLGGVGKSQIAIELAYRMRDHSSTTWVFWVYCGNAAGFMNSFRGIGATLKLIETNSSDKTVLESVSYWLEDDNNGPWVVVLDNVDDLAALRSSRESEDDRPLYDYIPSMQHGKRIITSRDRSMAYELVGDHDLLVPVAKMSENEAMALLKSRITLENSDHNVASDLLDLLDYLPLAITQASAYIKEMSPLVTLADYAREVRSNYENAQTSALSHGLRDLRRYDSVPDAVFSTLRITLNYLEENQPEAIKLLFLLASFHWQYVPQRFITDENPDRLFQESANILRNHSMIAIHDEQSISMHRLIHLIARAWMRVNGTGEEFRRMAVSCLAKIAESEKIKQSWESSNFMANANELTLHPFKSKEDELLRAEVLDMMSRISTLLQRDWTLAHEQNERVVEIHQRHLEPQDLTLLESLAQRGSYLAMLGKDEEAEATFAKVISDCEHSPESDEKTSLMLTCQTDLATSKSMLGKHDEAEKLCLEAFQTCTSKEGASHLKTLKVMGALAWVYHNQRRYGMAERINEQAYNLSLESVGSYHAETIALAVRLAHLKEHLGKTQEAITVLTSTVRAGEKLMGADNIHNRDLQRQLEVLRRKSSAPSSQNTRFRLILNVAFLLLSLVLWWRSSKKNTQKTEGTS